MNGKMSDVDIRFEKKYRWYKILAIISIIVNLVFILGSFKIDIFRNTWLLWTFLACIISGYIAYKWDRITVRTPQQLLAFLEKKNELVDMDTNEVESAEIMPGVIAVYIVHEAVSFIYDTQRNPIIIHKRVKTIDELMEEARATKVDQDRLRKKADIEDRSRELGLSREEDE